MGAFSVLAFHQGTIHILFNYVNGIPAAEEVIGRIAGPGWDMSRAIPNPLLPQLHIPVFFNSMFWGGIWGIVIAAVIRWTPLPDLFTATLIGAVGCTLAGMALAAQMRGVPVQLGGDSRALLQAGLVNAAFGFGTGFLLRPLVLKRVKPPPRSKPVAKPPPLRRQA